MKLGLAGKTALITGGRAIVNIATSSSKAPPASSLPTTTSRAAGLALTKALSRDLAPSIRVNAVCIGTVRSDQIEKRWRRSAPDLTWEQFATDPVYDIPLGENRGSAGSGKRPSSFGPRKQPPT